MIILVRHSRFFRLLTVSLLLVKSDKHLLSGEIASKVAWNSSAFLGPNLWDKDQLYSATTQGSVPASSSSSSSTTAAPGTGLHNEKSLVGTANGSNNGSSGNFKVENIDIDEFLCENNLNLNDIDSFSNHFEHVEQTRSNSPNQSSADPLLLHSPMQAAPAKSPLDDSLSYSLIALQSTAHSHSLLLLSARSRIVDFVEKIFAR